MSEPVGYKEVGDYCCQLNRQWLDEPLGEDDFQFGIQVTYGHVATGRMRHATVHGTDVGGMYMELSLESGDEVFFDADLRSAILSCISGCTYHIVEWPDNQWDEE